MSFFSKIIPDRSISRLQSIVLDINKREESLKSLSDDEIRQISLGLKKRAREFADLDEGLNELLPEAFALVREASKRTLKQRHFDVQLIGGMVLHEGNVAQMFTGEGKTLVATLPAYLNALSGKGTHVITVNDYLAKRDTVWMGQIYYALGLTVSCIVHDVAYQYDPAFAGSESSKLDIERDKEGSFKVVETFLRPISRKEAYQADITYGTNHEFGFDFLRDNLVLSLNECVQRDHYYAIIDEVDSILIDEARTPLIIAAPDEESSEYYKVFARIVSVFSEETDYEVDEKLRTVNITEEGINKVERVLGIQNIFAPDHSRLVHYLQESLKAKALFKKDKDYVVKNDEILIVDEFTGRILLGRRYSRGLHQAIEAKEGVFVKQENRTFAQITIQNYFRLYKKISGMTGTAETSGEEFHKVYDLNVSVIPPNKPVIRKDLPDLIYKDKHSKYNAITKRVKELNEKGIPVLLGTTSINNNEVISSYLSNAGIRHEVLNAKNNEREGMIIDQAGKKGSVTVATNMAGRGVDIVLGGSPYNETRAQEIRDLGGLHVIGTERHEARRIDNQLRGRSGRQGDPGCTQFFLSLEDDLMRIFGGDRIKNMMQAMKFPEDVPIESRMVSRSVNQAQTKVEGNNFDIRKRLLEFDDVLNKQRTAFYARREKLLKAGTDNEILPLLSDILTTYVTNLENAEKGEPDDQHEKTLKEAKERLASFPKEIEKERSVIISQHLVRILDTLWIDHLEDLESLRETVNIRAYAQHEPIVEYRREAHLLYQKLQNAFEHLTFNTAFQILEIKTDNLKPQEKKIPGNRLSQEYKNVGRNDPCPCGSGKKYKRCHGA